MGIESYASASRPCSATARTKEEDFRVEEHLVNYPIAPEPGPGYLPVYRVEKRSVDTLHMVTELSEELRSRVSFGGLKDKRAVAIQYVTPTSGHADRPKAVETDRFSARLVGYSDRRMSTAYVGGNTFRIVLRECCQEVAERVDEVYRLGREGRLPNFYGLQRFGTLAGGTQGLGKAIVVRDFQAAIELMLSVVRPEDDGQVRSAKEAMAAGRYDYGLRLLPRRLDTERKVAGRLAEKPGDWVGALRAVPIKLRRLFVHAFQSFIFNKVLSLALTRGVDLSKHQPGDNWSELREGGLVTGPVRGVRDEVMGAAVPMVQLPGYAYRDYGSRFDSLAKEVMAQEGVSAKDFYVAEMQEASAEGGFRIPHMTIADATCETEGEVAVLGFTLARGQYATILLREVVKPSNPTESGFR